MAWGGLQDDCWRSKMEHHFPNGTARGGQKEETVINMGIWRDMRANAVNMDWLVKREG